MKPPLLPPNPRTIALRLLSRRAYSAAELTERLARREVPPEQIATTLAWLQDKQLLSDEQVAASVVRLSVRHGRFWLQGKLHQRGIAKETAEQALAARSAADDQELALAEARRQSTALAGLPRELQRRRLTGRLLRRGFAATVVRDVCRQVLS